VYSDGASIPQCASHEPGWTISGGREQAVCCVKVEPRTCVDIAGGRCGYADQFCNYEESAGGQGCGGMITEAAGVCEAVPQTCEVGPFVCGCDYRSYTGRCRAHAAGISVLHEGACTDSDCAAIGGIVRGSGAVNECLLGEAEHGYVVGDHGEIPIEGAICCLPLFERGDGS
jgi:hypothetical protein